MVLTPAPMSPTPAAPTPTPRILPIPTLTTATADNLQAFWSQALDLSCSEMMQDEDWESLDQMTTDVDLVIVGRPAYVSTYFDEDWGEDRPLINVAVDDVLKGSLSSDVPNVVKLVDWYGTFADTIEAPIPAVPTVLFVRNTALREQYINESPQPQDQYTYYLPSDYQNVMPELDGKVFIPYAHRISAWIGANEFPLALEGTSFDKLVSQIRLAAGGTAESDGTKSGVRSAC
jgi:hypothetical protein